MEGFNDLFTTNHELRQEWDFEKNIINPLTISKGSSTKLWWICEYGHSFETPPNYRTRKGENCPYCSHSKLIKGVNDIDTSYPELAEEWHPFKNGKLRPNDVFTRSGKKYGGYVNMGMNSSNRHI